MKPTRLSRLTIRARLTLVYGGLFLLAGLLLLGVTYALISQQLPRGAKVTMSDAPTSGNGNPSSQQPLKPQLPEDEQMLKQQVAEDGAVASGRSEAG